MQRNVTSHRYYIGLLAGLLCVFVISPFFGKGSLAGDLLGIALLITLLFSVLVISHSKKLMMLATLLAVPLVFGSIQSIVGSVVEISSLIISLCGVAFVFLIISVMLRDMFTSTKVDGALIVGSISLYLLLGLMWGFIYMTIDYAFPGSFNSDFIQTMELKDRTGELMYYSMVTLTTLGYGDITPLSAPARAMATMEAVVGQLYLTVLVARLVGMHIAQKK